MYDKRLLVACTAVWACLLVLPASAVEVKISIENIAPSDSVATSPFLVAAHDGTFDAFDPNSIASLGIENVAELGDGTQLASDISTAQPSAVVDTVLATNGGFNGAIFKPGASGSIVLDLNPSIHRYLTFGAMVVPSNDAFFGNASPTEVELFDAGGNFVATNFTLVGSDVWDAGTEVNQLTGSAYVVGQSAGDGDTEGGTVQTADLNGLFSIYVGQQTPPGATFNTVPAANTPIASFSFAQVPEPSAMLLVAAGAFALSVPRRKKSR